MSENTTLSTLLRQVIIHFHITIRPLPIKLYDKTASPPSTQNHYRLVYTLRTSSCILGISQPTKRMYVQDFST